MPHRILLRRLGVLRRLRRDMGTTRALDFSVRWLKWRLGWAQIPDELRKNEAVDFYGYVLPRPFGPVGPLPTAAERTLNWVIPDFHIGSGGHTTIFRLIGHLERLGYRCRINLVGPCHYPSAAAAAAVIREHFFPLQAEVGIGEASIRPAWATFATSWDTAYRVRDFRATRVKCYFIQDFEPVFFAAGSESVFAENTYRMGFFGITAGDWLATQVAQRYGMRARPIRFGVDHDIYRPASRPRPSGGRRVFFYARPVTPRRGFELGLLALTRLATALPDLHVVFAGWDVGNYLIPFAHTSLGTVSPRGLAAAIADCDAALVLSLTNLSLLPLEVMACGCPVVSNDGPHVEWLLRDGDNALLTASEPVALAAALERVLSDAELRRGLVERGLAQARSADWAAEARQFRDHLVELAGETGVDAGRVEPACAS